jgi:L-ascorbate peroxidase
MAGGCSWTRNWLQFDNSYFRLRGDTQARRRASLKEGELLEASWHQERNPVSLNWVAHGRDPELLWLPTDNALQTDPEFRTHFERYGKDQAAFFRDYAAAHRKMSLLGARFDSLGPVSLE